MAAKPKPVCKHHHLHFEAGGLYLICDDCKYTWAAVGHCPMKIMQDINARSMGYSEMDKRSDPIAPIKQIAKTAEDVVGPSRSPIDLNAALAAVAAYNARVKRRQQEEDEEDQKVSKSEKQKAKAQRAARRAFVKARKKAKLI